MIEPSDKRNLQDSAAQMLGTMRQAEDHATMLLNAAQSSAGVEAIVISTQVITIEKRLKAISREILMLEAYAKQIPEFPS